MVHRHFKKSQGGLQLENVSKTAAEKAQEGKGKKGKGGKSGKFDMATARESQGLGLKTIQRKSLPSTDVTAATRKRHQTGQGEGIGGGGVGGGGGGVIYCQKLAQGKIAWLGSQEKSWCRGDKASG